MTPQPADLIARRNRRKQDLLLASALARHQAVGAIHQISPRVDTALHLYQQVRGWGRAAPVAGALASAAALYALRRVRIHRLAHWGALGWRIGTIVSGLLAARRGAG